MISLEITTDSRKHHEIKIKRAKCRQLEKTLHFLLNKM